MSSTFPTRQHRTRAAGPKYSRNRSHAQKAKCSATGTQQLTSLVVKGGLAWFAPLRQPQSQRRLLARPAQLHIHRRAPSGLLRRCPAWWSLLPSWSLVQPHVGTLWITRNGTLRAGTLSIASSIYFMQAWAMEPGQRILKVHGDSQQVADCLTKIMTPQVAHRRALGL